MESAYGRAMPVVSNNPFGIKAMAGQPYVEAMTREVENGVRVHKTQRFAKYISFAEVFEAHGHLLAANKSTRRR